MSKVTTFYSFLYKANAFNHDHSGWDVSSVTDMAYMFASSVFNQDLSAWDVSSVTSMDGMFAQATAFNSPLTWGSKVASVTTMIDMFNGATAFNQDISGRSVISVTHNSNIFYSAPMTESNKPCTSSSNIIIDGGTAWRTC